jgi:hypothetical protein
MSERAAALKKTPSPSAAHTQGSTIKSVSPYYQVPESGISQRTP